MENKEYITYNIHVDGHKISEVSMPCTGHETPLEMQNMRDEIKNILEQTHGVPRHYFRLVRYEQGRIKIY